MMRPTLAIEKKLWKSGVRHIVGVDEAGRGALAGPVVAAAVVFAPLQKVPAELRGVRDSKQLTARAREKLYPAIVSSCLAWAVGVVSHRLIDRVNIANATYRAMQMAVAKLDVSPSHLLIDGLLPRHHNSLFSIPHSAYIRGDRRIFSIAAASIVAKVTRDRLMRCLHARYEAYGFDHHKGYGTVAHYAILRRHGSCPIHRRSFYLGA